jgi:hypothetical protein
LARSHSCSSLSSTPSAITVRPLPCASETIERHSAALLASAGTPRTTLRSILMRSAGTRYSVAMLV